MRFNGKDYDNSPTEKNKKGMRKLTKKLFGVTLDSSPMLWSMNSRSTLNYDYASFFASGTGEYQYTQIVSQA